jgi:peptidoglycan hydrolase-like protein with peptidoglycan-binding domain
VTRRAAALCAASLTAFTLAAAAHASNPQIAGLQVALRAYGLYNGSIDAIAGPKTVRATKAFQRRAGIFVDGLPGPKTRRALGPLGAPLFGRRTLRVGKFGWDVSVLQFLLARRGVLVPVDGYFDAATAKALRRFQRSRRLAVDGVAGPHTLSALARGRPELTIGKARVRPAPSGVRGLLQHWAAVYRVDPGLVRALAWMESGNQPGLVSPSGARGVMQVLPSTKAYVETVLLRKHVPWTVSGGIRVGVVYLREVLREFHGNESLGLAAWYQGPASVRRDGVHAGTKTFVANVLALRRRGV